VLYFEPVTPTGSEVEAGDLETTGMGVGEGVLVGGETVVCNGGITLVGDGVDTTRSESAMSNAEVGVGNTNCDEKFNPPELNPRRAPEPICAWLWKGAGVGLGADPGKTNWD